MGHRSLCDAFEATATRCAGDVALRTPDGSLELTWAEYGERSARLALGLAGLGVAPGDTVGLLLPNSPEFHLVDTAALRLGAAPFSIYQTSTVEQIAHVLRNSRARVVVAAPAFAERVLEAREQAPCVRHVVGIQALDAGPPAELDLERRARAVRPDTVATIIYTSGTTGPPKGVLLTHRNLLAAWEASVAAVPALSRRGRYMSYLPTAHLADRVFSHYPAMITGSAITCVDDVRAAVALLGQIRPTLWLAVPRIWEKLKDAIEALLASGTVPADEIAARLGLDAADLLVSGSAPIRPDVLQFFAGLGIGICEGYGMTECSAVATLNRPGFQRIGTVGTPLPGVEVDIADDGEVLLRGTGIMAGHRGEPGLTAETIDDDGWLHTGDVGALDAEGYLVIVDRKKELIINSAGKNMSPANIEARLKAASPLIGHAVAIGDRRPFNTALLVPDPDMLGFHGLALGDAELRERVAAAVAEANIHLSRVEQIKRWVVIDDPWEPGGELLTETLKLRRKPIADRYADVIDALYDQATEGHFMPPPSRTSTVSA